MDSTTSANLPPLTSDSSRTPNGKTVSIVFFDGICGFCNHTVNFLMARDSGHRLQFAPLQGQTAARWLPEDLRDRLDSLVFLRNGHTWVRSAAVVRILHTLGGKWRLAATALWLIPLPLRDLAYRIIACVRYRLFGKHESCRIPSPEERDRILD